MTSRVHHLNCLTLSPIGTFGGRVSPARMVAHCLLVEGDAGLTLVDTGLGTGDLGNPTRVGRPFLAALRPAMDPAETALAQVRALGFQPDDLRDIVLTHLDVDHAGGIGDFPQARVHVHSDELAAARARKSPKEKGRYITAQWAHGPRWTEHVAGGESWFGLESVQAVGDDVLMVPMRGHTRGHCAVAVRRPGGGWFLHAGDAYFNTGEKQTPPTCPSGLRGFQTLVQMDKLARHHNQERIRELHAAHSDEVTVFSAHDAGEFDALAGHTD